jgi:galactokinase/mevalonate kinase-like predicted kinase
MVSHSNLHRPTQSLLFSEREYSPKKSRKENFRPSLSVTLPASLGLGYSWREISSFIENFSQSQLWKEEFPSDSTVVNALFVKTQRDENRDANGLSTLLEPAFSGMNFHEQSKNPKIELHQLECHYVFREKKEHYQQKNMKKIALDLERMRIDRNKADYSDVVQDLKTVTQETLKRANRVISALNKL